MEVKTNKDGEPIFEFGWTGSNPKEYPHEYFVTRENDWHNEEMFEEWMNHSRGATLRIKRVYVHSDIEIPVQITRKVLRDVFKSGVEFNHRYFAGVKRSIDIGLDRFNEIDAFESAAVRIKRGKQGLTLDMFLKAKKPIQPSLRLEPMNNSVGLTGEFVFRNMFKQLDTFKAGGSFGLFELAIRNAEIEHTFPASLQNLSVKPFLRYELQPISFGASELSVSQMTAGVELFRKPSQGRKHSLTLEYLGRKINLNIHPQPQLRPDNLEADFIRERLRDGNVDSFVGGRLSYRLEGKRQLTRLLKTPVDTDYNLQVGILAGNDLGVELKAKRLAQTSTRGYFTSSILHLSHLATLDIFQSFHGSRGLIVNGVYDENPRIHHNFRKDRLFESIMPQGFRLNNTVRVDFSGFSDSSVKDAIRPFIFAHSSIGVANPANVTEQATVKNHWQAGVGFSWAAMSQIFFNTRLTLFSHLGVSPALTADFKIV